MSKFLGMCNYCGKELSALTKVPKRRIHKKCQKIVKAKYDKQRDRTIPITIYTPRCKYCGLEFETTKHDKLYCCDEHKKLYANTVRRIKRSKVCL